MLIYSVIGMVKEHTEHWSENNEHKVCELYSGSVCVRMQGSTVIHNNDDVMFQEDYDQELLVKVCSVILYTNSVVFKECVIDNKSLPRGALDIVCGCLNTEDFSINLGVTIDKNETERTIGNP